MTLPQCVKICHLFSKIYNYRVIRQSCIHTIHKKSVCSTFAHSKRLSSQDSHQTKQKQDVKPAGKVKTYAVKKYVNFVDRYIATFENRFQKHYPKAFEIYKLFKDGVRDFFRDSKQYYHVATQLWGGKTLAEFNREQLENYRQIPSDMIRVAPVLLISSLPFANYVVFPVAYMFPRQLLCRHFWTPEQRVQFAVYNLHHRLHVFPSILNFLMKQSDTIKDSGKRKVFSDLLQEIENGKTEPNTEAILDCKSLFINRPFGIDHLYRTHRIHMQWNIAKCLGFPGVKRKLVPSTRLLWNIDLAMTREGIRNMSLEQLQQACFNRCLNAEGLAEEELVKYLVHWTTLSNNINDNSLSLLLHAPVLLGYNRPSNQKYLIKSVDVTQGVIKP